MVAKKRRAFEEWLHRRDRVTDDRTPGTESGCETGSQSCKKNGGPVMVRAIGE